MIYVGIDPGQRGGLSAINEENEIIFCLPMSNDNLINSFENLKEYSESLNVGIVACIEKVSAMPGQGVTSMFNFGKGAGFIEGVLSSFKIPYQLVPPNAWKKSFSLLHKGKKDSIAVCKQLFPSANLLPNSRCRKDSDGMAESLLLAYYAKRKLK